MLKKIILVGAVGLLTAALLTQTKLGSHAKAWLQRTEDRLEAKIPAEEEVRRLKMEVGELDDEIDAARAAVAEERVEAKMLRGKVDDMSTQVKTSRNAVDARAKAITDAGDTRFVKWDGSTINISLAKEKLQAQVNAHKALEKNFKSQETMLNVRERTRDLAEQHLTSLVSQKAELEAALVEMEADIKQLKIEQVESKYQNDGTKMAGVKDSLAKLKKRIEVQREKLNLAKKYDPKSVENKTVEEIMAELDSKDKNSVAGTK